MSSHGRHHPAPSAARTIFIPMEGCERPTVLFSLFVMKYHLMVDSRLLEIKSLHKLDISSIFYQFIFFYLHMRTHLSFKKRMYVQVVFASGIW